jgi:GST-like protein
MIKAYLGGGPNPRKVALLLEEAGIAYERIWVNTSEGQQLSPEFAALNPNCKVPVIVDDDRTVFDSNAILLYLAEKHEAFVPPRGSPDWAAMISWLMFVATGVGPYSGQAVHFQHAAPEHQPYAITRYLYEANRHFAVLEERLAGRDWLVGDAYSIVDMALWGWGTFLPRILGEDSQGVYPRVEALMTRISARPAAERAVKATTGSSTSPPKIYANPNLFRYLAPQVA